jgi:hypothetical protein
MTPVRSSPEIRPDGGQMPGDKGGTGVDDLA